jgi:cysteine desulfurase
MAPIYLDHNATTPLAPAVAEAMAEVWAGGPGNAASQHGFGRNARHMLETAREGIAELLGAKVSGMDADRLIFTSGGTEANHLALRGLAGTRGHLVTSSIEHPSVLITAEQLAKEGWLVDRLPADSQGVVQIDPLNDVLRLETRLVSLMFGNNETGVLQGVAEAARICEQAVQVVGKLPVHFRKLGVAALSCTAHKFHGPQGIGALLVRHGIAIEPQMYGGFQQAGLRPGTEPVARSSGTTKGMSAPRAWPNFAIDSSGKLFRACVMRKSSGNMHGGCRIRPTLRLWVAIGRLFSWPSTSSASLAQPGRMCWSQWGVPRVQFAALCGSV